MNYIKQNHLSLLIILWFVLGSVFSGVNSQFGAIAPNLTTIGNPITFTNTQTPGGVTISSSTVTTLKVGAIGTGITQILRGTCALIYSNPSVTATTTRVIDCVATGAINTDTVFVSLATTTTAGAFGNWYVSGAGASTTAGYITIHLVNGTGGTVVIPQEIASSTRYLILR